MGVSVAKLLQVVKIVEIALVYDSLPDAYILADSMEFPVGKKHTYGL